MMTLNFKMNLRHATMGLIIILQVYLFLKTQLTIKMNTTNTKTLKRMQ